MLEIEMRTLALAPALLLALSLPAHAQDSVTPAAPPAPPPVTLTAGELDALIQALADTPARWSFQPLQMLLAKRQAATAPTQPKAR